MKNIKHFIYQDTHTFNVFLKEHNYILDDVKGFSLYDKEHYHGNVLKTYSIYFKDGEHVYFSVAIFKSFNEYRQSALGFNGDKLLQ